MALQIDLNPRSYRTDQAAVFFRSRERNGDLSNMTGGFPLTANAVSF